MKNIPQVFVGVDVAKKHLDIHLYPGNKDIRVENSDKGICEFTQLLSGYNVTQIIVEPTGGYEQNLVKSCKKANYKVWMVNPKLVRAFITSEGINFKTDKIDAQMIALFGARKSNNSHSYESPVNEELRTLVRRRADLVAIVAKEKVRVDHPSQVHCKQRIEAHIEFLTQEIASLEDEILIKIKQDESLSAKMDILTSVPGIGKTTASILLVEMPELGNLSNNQIAALLGVAPMVRQSGISKGKAATQGGRHNVRHAFYMAAVVGITHNKVLKEFYLRLKEAGKPSKVALVAVMRKFIVILNVMLKKEEMWKMSPC